METRVRVLVAIPVFNEAAHLRDVLNAVRRHARNILVVDDGSTDATPELLGRERGVQVLRQPENRGYGQSLIEAFRYACRRRFDWVLTLDCDEQHEPAQIPEFAALAGRDVADVISGSRYLRERPDDDPAPADRLAINQCVNRLLHRHLGLRLTDSFCGFKAHRVEALCRLDLDEPGYAFPLQFWVQCARAGLRILEHSVRRIYRDTSRTFGGTLDDPAARLNHYLSVFHRELRRTRSGISSPCSLTACPSAACD